MHSARNIALRLLMEYEELGKYVNLSLSSHARDSLSAEERGFVTALLYGAVEHKITYDYIISAISGRSISDITPRARAILRLGLCQILLLDNIPDYAAVNETVKLASNPGERAFVNGVLRKAVRELDSLPMPDRRKDEARYLSVMYSVPKPTVKHFISLLGASGCEEYLKYINTTPPTDITVNTTKITKDALLSRLRSLGYRVEQSEISERTLRVYGSFDPRAVSEFKEGLFFVQDAASAASSLALGSKPGELVVDVCACPGGKSFAAAIMMENRGRVESFDIHESKIPLISDGARRLGLNIISASLCDAREGREELLSRADRVICDVPCSGLGVLAKKPDLRYKDIGDISKLCAIQYAILERSAKYLRPGGYILYSTCTLNPAENEITVERFLSENPDYTRADFKLGNLSSDRGMLTLYPHIHKTDGFFFAKLKRL